MAQEIDINLNVNAEQADKSLGSLKSQLREAQQDVQKLADKFGATSTEAVNAAKRAAELKDRIGDAKDLTEAFNPDAKFKALSASLSGVAGGFAAYQGAMGLVGVESKDLEKQLLKVQSAMAIAQGFQALGEARDSFKQLKAVAIDAFNGIKTAIGSTGIGLLVVAAGALYAYWDDIKAAVSGVSEEQKKLNAESKKNLTQEQEKLKAIGNQDEILKLQGKSESEILKMKIAQTDETIAAAKVDLKRIETTNKEQQKAVELNYQYLKSFIDFISIPQRLIFENGAKAINKVIDLINKIPGVKIDARIDEKFADKAADYITKLGFDPEKTKAEGKKTVDAAKLYLDELANNRARFQNQINTINKKAAEDANLTEEEKKKKLKELNDDYNKKLAEEQTEFDLTDLQKQQDKLNADAKFKEDEIAAEEAHQLALTELQYNSQYEREEREEAERQRKLERAKEIADALISVASNLANGLEGIEALGNKKSKAAGAIKKGIALVDLSISTATALGSAVKEARAAGAAAQAIFPTVPGVGIAASIASYASSAGMVFGNIAKAKQLLSGDGGGGGGGASSGGGGGGAMSAPAAPSFNVVGPSGANQIAESIGAREMQPLKAFVVGGDVTTQQQLNRGIVQNATLG
jgi:hypothetical protein